MQALTHRYCNRGTVQVGAVGVLLTAVIAAVAMFATAGPRGTALGVHLGADYAQFYAVGLLQNRYGIGRLYDLPLQDAILHEAVVGMPKADSLPFVYPPFVAPPFRGFATLPYAASVALWLAISAACYVTALAVVFRVCPAIPREDRPAAWLLALAFSPFAAETWLGGQLSVIGTLAVAVALACHRTGRSGWAGLALSVLLYKPPLTGLIVLMLIVGRRWRTLAGFAGGAVVLAGLSAAVVGIEGSIDYVRLLAWYGRAREESAEVFRAAKYLDLTTCLTLLGFDRATARPLAVLLALPLVAALAFGWHRTARRPEPDADAVWAATLCFVPLLSNYGPIYDATLAVPGLILGADVIRRRHPIRWPAGFAGVIAAVFLSGLASTLLAAAYGVQALTPALATAGIYFLRAGASARVADAALLPAVRQVAAVQQV